MTDVAAATTERSPSRLVLPRVVLITDDDLDDDVLVARLEACLAAVPPGSVSVQLRDKRRLGAELLRRAERVAACCQLRGTPFMVNDRLDVAKLLGAAGVHLGGASVGVAEARAFVGAEAIITVAAHTAGEVIQAARRGASAVMVSPVFDTPGKGPPRGTAFLGSACRAAAGLPVFALGGVDARRAGDCIASGAYGVAVIRAVFAAGDPAGAASALCGAVDRAVAQRGT